VQAAIGPGGKIVVVFRVVELGAQQVSPEVMGQAVGRDLLQGIPEFLQVLHSEAGGKRDQRAIAHLERQSCRPIGLGLVHIRFFPSNNQVY